MAAFGGEVDGRIALDSCVEGVGGGVEEGVHRRDLRVGGSRENRGKPHLLIK